MSSIKEVMSLMERRAKSAGFCPHPVPRIALACKWNLRNFVWLRTVKARGRYGRGETKTFPITRRQAIEFLENIEWARASRHLEKVSNAAGG
ncbi:hypothetical protein [Paraburkholderia sp. BL27I4N3]|uniref:hypothetical protein n=1 Tax=Paraburkholderia sp. BL27I4N3 TaxID=1938805 RepID=UPI0011C02487|nr:hypothetical protein [Paraburkholderia sp. BL27I4N3]